MSEDYDILRKIKFNQIIKRQNMTFFQWLNGKKTIIGSVFLFLAVFGTEVMQDIWGLKCLPEATDCAYDWLSKSITTSSWIGMVLGGTGLIHKGIKSGK